jgi:hypothetical protein
VEFGVGGGTSPTGDRKATTAEEAAYTPFFGREQAAEATRAGRRLGAVAAAASGAPHDTCRPMHQPHPPCGLQGSAGRTAAPRTPSSCMTCPAPHPCATMLAGSTTRLPR